MKNNIKWLRLAVGMTQADLAKATGVGVPQVSKWEAGRVDIPASRLAEIAYVLGTTPDTLLAIDYIDPYANSVRKDGAPPPGGRVAPHVPESNASPFKLEGPSNERMREDLPIYGTALGAAREVEGEAIEQTTLNRAEVIQYAKRPVILNGNSAAYGLYVSGSSMEPRHMDGDILLVDPKGRVRGGEDVVVYLRPANPDDDNGEMARAVLVKRLVRRTASYLELEQYTPAKVFKIDAADIVRVDRVIPWQELIG